MKKIEVYWKSVGFLFRNSPFRYGLFLFLSVFSMVKEAGILAASYFGIQVFTGSAGGGGRETQLLVLGLLGILLGELLNFWINKLYNALDYGLESSLYQETLRNLAHINLLDMQDNRTAGLVQDVFENGKDAASILVFNFIYYLRMAVMIAIYSIVGIRMGAAYCIGALAAFFLLAVAVYFLKQKQEGQLYDLSRLGLKRQYWNGLFCGEKYHEEMLAGHCAGYFLAGRKKADGELSRYLLANQKYSSAVSLLCYGTIGLVFLADIVFLYFRYADGKMGVEGLSAVAMVTYLLYIETLGFLDKVAMDKEAVFHAVNLWRLFGMEKDAVLERGDMVEEIQVSGLEFSYQGREDGLCKDAGEREDGLREDAGEREDGSREDTRVLKGVSFSLRKGERALLLGENGAGKTTLLGILSGLFEASGGTVRANQMPQGDTLWLRRHVAVVSQSYPILSLSIRNNLFLQEGVAEEAIWDVMKKVGLYEKIKGLPDGLDTVMGNLGDGTSFSKGQWQRFAIARMLLKKEAEIWILDEATSALDALAENAVFRLIMEEGKGKMILFVTHRLSIAGEVDRILCLEDGRVACSGTHKELYAANAVYRARYDSQREMYQ